MFAMAIGSIDFSFEQLLDALFSQTSSVQHNILWQLRWPRAASAFAAGGLLATAGVLMQVLLRNPLADPYILGTSGGAAVFALLALLSGLGGIWVTGSAFAGALLSTILVFSIAHGRGSWTANRLLLTGVVIAFGWGALISFLLVIAPQMQLRGMLYWLMGDLSYSQYSWSGLAALLLVFTLCLPMLRQLDILQRGNLQAAALGVNLRHSQWIIFTLAALCTAIAVSLAGTVGFVGLIVPHLLRLMIGTSQHRWILPGSILLGGSLLVMADTLARVLFAPAQLPVGVMTAAIGVPLFLLMLYRGQQR
jgi:iron complex transport system permease protein